jgi:hypothetical protein
MFTALLIILGHAMAKAVSHWPLTVETRVQLQANPCGICGGQSGIGSGLLLSISVLPCQYHSASALHSLVYHILVTILSIGSTVPDSPLKKISFLYLVLRHLHQHYLLLKSHWYLHNLNVLLGALCKS